MKFQILILHSIGFNMLGLGHTLVRGSFLSGFENKFALDFDGSDDYALAGISGQDPANDTIKPITPTGLTLAAWVRLDNAEDPYNTTSSHVIYTNQMVGILWWVLGMVIK